MTGKTILHYEVGERLGEGGMGQVYKARDTRLGRPVALKFLTAAAQSDPESRRRLLREAQASSLLRSPNIAVTFDIAEHDGTIFIVMEYVEGEVLLKRIERGPLPVREALEVAVQTADALDEAHSRGIIHRDIKSANIMITGRGLVKVLDFGLAKFIESRDAEMKTVGPGVERTTAGMILGTVSYMSPEQALGRPLDATSDLFSLGVVLYQMLTGKLPFEGGSLTEVVDRILHHHPPPPDELNRAVPPRVSALVRRVMEKDPRYRHRSARELHLELREVLRDLETEDVSSRTARLPPPSVRSSGLREARVENAVAVMTFTNITKEPTDDWIGSGIAETVTADLKKIQGLSVIGRARIFEVLKNLSSREMAVLNEGAAIDLGRRLGATWIVGGGYQRLGPLIRVTSQLVDVRSGDLVKTLKLDGEISRIFELQDKIVYELSRDLNLKLERTEMKEIERKETASVEAYECYSRALMNLRAADPESLDRAIYLFEKALEIDPDYASAWAELGSACNLKGTFLGMPELVQKAIECERKALALNPRMPSAHSYLGFALGNSGRHDEAIGEVQEAIRLDPQNAQAHFTLGRLLWMGKGQVEEGIAALEKSVALNPEAGYAYLQLGFLYAVAGDLARAEAACRKAVDLQEQAISGNEGLRIVGAHSRLGYVYHRQGRYREALEEYRRELSFLSSKDHILRERTIIEVNQKMGATYLKLGLHSEAGASFEEARKAFDSRVAKGMDDPFTRYYMACLHALRGEPEKAVRSLAESLKKLGAFNRRRARLDPELDGLRDNPEFEKLMATA